MELSISTRILCFIVISLFLLKISWRPLHNPKCHGFYRFFAFEGILFLVMLNVTVWFKNPFSIQQVVSWFFLFFSVLIVLNGFIMLKSKGGHDFREEHQENYIFENTSNLVEEGIFRFIRHPMYASLLFLAWGAFMKHPSFLGSVVVALTTFALIATAKVEEQENIAFFGSKYQDYKKRSKMFIPFIL